MPEKADFIAALESRCGAERIRRFRAAMVTVCGAGGLGSNIALALARAGVGRLKIIDFDRVDLTNINRQQYKPAQIGMLKTDAIKENILEAAPYATVETAAVRMTKENTGSLLEGCCIVCEAFDDAVSKAMLVNHVREHMPSAYVVAASGMSGLGDADDIRTRQVSPRFYVCGDFSSTVEQGLYAPRVMLCAAHQALAVLRILAGEED